MGLDTSYDCWNGSYSAFNTWRTKVCEVAGYGSLKDRHGFGGELQWPDDDPLAKLLYHSDCEGELEAVDCGPIADRLEELMPALTKAGFAGGHIGSFADKTQTFIDGLRMAHSENENVEFY